MLKREHEVRFPDKFWRRSTHLSIDAKALYAVLATFADYKTGETYVSNARLQLETGHGLRKIKTLLNEIQRGGFITRRREYHRNLKAKRYIRCLKYVVSEQKAADSPMAPILHHRLDGSVFDRSRNDPVSLPLVKSSVTPEEQEDSSFPHRASKPERIM
jgi:hypothetical protein